MSRTPWMVAALLLSAAVASADANDPAEVLERMREAQGRMTTLTARIAQVKSFPQLGIEDPPETGRLVIARGAETRVRMEILEPEVRILTTSEGEYLLYQPRIRQALTGKLGASGAKGLFAGILTGSAEATDGLSRDYVVEPGERAAEPGVVSLRFEARPGSSVYCERIELWVDEETSLPVRQSCHEANDSVITFSLSDVELDVELDDDAFDVEIPEGVERVRG